jgi:hypothetical protein
VPSKEQSQSDDKTASKRPSRRVDVQVLDTSTQQAPLATVIQRARFDASTLTPRDILQLQPIIGNQAVGRLLKGISQRYSTSNAGTPSLPSLAANQSVRPAITNQVTSPTQVVQRAVTFNAHFADPDFIEGEATEIDGEKASFDENAFFVNGEVEVAADDPQNELPGWEVGFFQDVTSYVDNTYYSIPQGGFRKFFYNGPQRMRDRQHGENGLWYNTATNKTITNVININDVEAGEWVSVNLGQFADNPTGVKPTKLGNETIRQNHLAENFTVFISAHKGNVFRHLKKITWNNDRKTSFVDIDDEELSAQDTRNSGHGDQANAGMDAPIVAGDDANKITSGDVFDDELVNNIDAADR